MVMELFPGVDAHTLLRERRQLTPGETVQIVAQVCEALAYTHDPDRDRRACAGSRPGRTAGLGRAVPRSGDRWAELVAELAPRSRGAARCGSERPAESRLV